MSDVVNAQPVQLNKRMREPRNKSKRSQTPLSPAQEFLSQVQSMKETVDKEFESIGEQLTELKK
eukprot:CAMPEP_0168518892 /NCGR_PEP_ID=MMETSP0405-20121227/6992_1 /TAXON_ID=498012 /ORGANISM="Trichosphaerium sp, Strain Am-I-7 wt" /LENGTH=63 /DNA_ID=CAMNT_0008539329 /DNA_START=189 /DNA_END=380 /DNA_ORIENTATION=+